MSKIIIGSARVDERGKYSGGRAGDQTKKEVSTQPYYKHPKGWYVLRPKKISVANAIADSMNTACANPNVGYDQGNRESILKYGTKTKTKCECDCGSLVRQCVKEASGKDPGNFNTENEASMLEKSGLFENRKSVGMLTKLYNGDVLVTKTKGHTVVVVSGRARKEGKKANKKYSGEFPKLPSRGYYTIGDGYEINTTYTSEIKKIQKFLNWVCNASLDIDGKYGKRTSDMVRKFQKQHGLEMDGKFGARTLKKAKTVKR